MLYLLQFYWFAISSSIKVTLIFRDPMQLALTWNPSTLKVETKGFQIFT